MIPLATLGGIAVVTTAMIMNENEIDWTMRYYQGAVGFTVKSVGMSEDGFPFLILKKRVGNKTETLRLEVSQDEEGNGAGFLFGLPIPDGIK